MKFSAQTGGFTVDVEAYKEVSRLLLSVINHVKILELEKKGKKIDTLNHSQYAIFETVQVADSLGIDLGNWSGEEVDDEEIDVSDIKFHG